MVTKNIFIIIIVVLTPLVACSTKSADPDLLSGALSTKEGKMIFKDTFENGKIGAHWLDTSKGSAYAIKDGALRVQGAHNKPLWLTKKLPRNVRIDFSAKSVSSAVDIKVEVFGDGKSFATQASYTASSYVLIFGGWNNSRSIIARLNEHGKDRIVRTNPKGVVNKQYKFSIIRKGKLLQWFIDGKRFLEINDNDPLEGSNHNFFAINNWETEVYFDDLVIYKL